MLEAMGYEYTYQTINICTVDTADSVITFTSVMWETQIENVAEYLYKVHIFLM